MPANAEGYPGGPLGLGASYRLFNRRASDGSVFIKQGYVLFKHLWIDGLTFKGGRFSFGAGLEVLGGDPTLDWLKKYRISQRLLGSWEWSQVGRSFDGAVAGLTRGPLNVTAFYSKPTQGGLDLAANKTMNEIDLVYAALNLTRPWFTRNSDGRIFYIYYGISADSSQSTIARSRSAKPVAGRFPSPLSAVTGCTSARPRLGSLICSPGEPSSTDGGQGSISVPGVGR